MNDFHIGRYRGVPLHAEPVQAHEDEDAAQQSDLQRDAAAQDTSQNNALQQDAAPASEMQLHAPEAKPQQKPLPIEAYTISVDQVREHFRSKGVTKSKDTVQRWCRTGELDCQKRGVLGRYFTTEPSLQALEEKLLPDMMAANVGTTSLSDLPAQPDADSGAQVDAAETSAAATGTQAHATEGHADRSNMQLDAAESNAARSEMQVHEPTDAPADRGTPRRVPVQTAELSETVGQLAQQASAARLEAEVEGLRAQLMNRDEQIAFFQEEIRSARDQRNAVVQISNRMLETLETMAIGGRLERRNPQDTNARQSTESTPVHSPDPRGDRVY